jgi:hypothetical protein
MHLDQPATVLRLFARHLVEEQRKPENLRAGHPHGGEDMAVGLLRVDGEREDLCSEAMRTHDRTEPFAIPCSVALRPCWGDIRGRQSPKTAVSASLALSRSTAAGNRQQPQSARFCLFNLCGAIAIGKPVADAWAV